MALLKLLHHNSTSRTTCSGYVCAFAFRNGTFRAFTALGHVRCIKYRCRKPCAFNKYFLTHSVFVLPKRSLFFSPAVGGGHQVEKFDRFLIDRVANSLLRIVPAHLEIIFENAT